MTIHLTVLVPIKLITLFAAVYTIHTVLHYNKRRTVIDN